MTSPAAGRKAAQIADDFLNEDLESDTAARACLVEKITAALEEAEQAGYKRAMARRF